MKTNHSSRPDPRKTAMERTRVRVITAGRDQQKHKKQQDRLARQEQQLAEKLVRQSSRSVAPSPKAATAPKPAASHRPSAQRAKKPLKVPSAASLKNGFQVIAGGKKKKLFRWIGLAAALVIVVILVNSMIPIGFGEYVQNIFAGTGTGDGFPVGVSSSQTNHMLSVGGDIALVGDSSLLLYKSNGKLLADRQHGFSKPAAAACSARILVYDRGGKGLRMENRAKTIFSLDAKGPITTAAMAENGSFAVVTRGENYVSEATYYNASGKEKFVWHSASKQIVGVALSDNGRYMAISTLFVEGGRAVTGLMLLDTRRGSTLFEHTTENATPISLDMKGTATVAVLSDRVCSITKTGKRNDFLYDGGAPICFDNQNDTRVVLVLELYQDTKNTRLITLNKKAQPVGQSDLQSQAIALSAKNGDIAILADQQVLFYNQKASLRKQIPLQSEARTILCKGNRAILLGSDTLEEVHK